MISSLRKYEERGIALFSFSVLMFLTCSIYGVAVEHNFKSEKTAATREDKTDKVTNSNFEDELRKMTNEQLRNLAEKIIQEERLTLENFSKIVDSIGVDSEIANNLNALYHKTLSELGVSDGKRKTLEEINKIIEEKLLNDGDLFSLYQELSKFLKEENKEESEANKLLKETLNDLNKKLNEILQAKNDDHKKDELNPLKDFLDKLGDKGEGEPSGEEGGGGGGDQGGGPQGGGGNGMGDTGGNKPSWLGSKSNNNKTPDTKLPKNESKKKDEPKKDNKKDLDLEPKKESSEDKESKENKNTDKTDTKGIENSLANEEPREISKEAQQLITPGDSNYLNKTFDSTPSNSNSLGNSSTADKDLGLSSMEDSVFNVGVSKPLIRIQGKYPYTQLSDSDFAQANGDISNDMSSYTNESDSTSKTKNTNIIINPRKPATEENRGIFSKRILQTVCNNNPDVGICKNIRKNKNFLSLGAL